MTTSPRITAPKRVYPSKGYCIYCGRTNAPLTLEHIVPHGLGGRLLFEGASCEECRLAIHPVEELCLRRMFFAYRVRQAFPTRHRKEWPDSFPMYLGDAPGTRVDVPATEYPRLLIFPAFPLPGIMVGRDYNKKIQVELRLIVNKGDNDTLLKYGPKARFEKYHLNPYFFCRMLAKIGHSFAVAHLGQNRLDKYEMLLPDLIIGGIENPLHLVGMNNNIRPSSNHHFYRIELGTSLHNGQYFLAAKIRLFPNMKTPDYVVVIARAEGPPSQDQFSP